MNAYFVDAGQLLDLKNNDIGEEEYAEDMELEGIAVATSEKQN